jgi:hypothetical protein
VDADIPPQKQATTLDNDAAYSNCGGKRGAQHRTVADLDNAVSALALLRFIGALKLDQVRSAGLLLSQLQPAILDRKVGVALRYLAVVFSPERSTYLQ